MARNPGAEAPFAVFGALLHGHLRAGRRPDPNKREPWSDTAFSKTQPGRGETSGVSPRTVANWRKGRSLPSQIEPVLEALFGPFRGDGERDREELRAAYLTAREPLDRETLRQTKPDPVGEIFVVAGDHLAIDRNPSMADVGVAATPGLAAQHAEALRLAERLVPMIRRRGNSLSIVWDDLLPTVERFLTAIQRPTTDLPGRLAAMYQASVGMGGLVQQDDHLRAHPEDGERPLPVDLRRVLMETVTASVLLSRAFPSNQLRDGMLRDYWRPEAMPEALKVVEDAKTEEVVEQRDGEALDEMIADAAHPATQGEKSKGRLFATLRNMVLAGASAIIFSGIANESELVKRLSRFVVRAEGPILAVMDGAPIDAIIAMRNTLERAKGDPTDHGPSAPFGIPGATQPARRALPPFGPDEVERMILAGEAPPDDWVPFIKMLDFSFSALQSLDALRGLTSLQELSLDSTPVSDLDALRGLTSLQTLSLDSTPVSDLDALRGLTSLQSLSLDSTQVSDLDALRGLTSLQSLWLDSTQVSDLDALRGLTSLQSLWLNSTPVSDLDALRGLTSLLVLWLDSTPVSDLDALRGLTSLLSLSLDSTEVSDLDALRGLTSLLSLSLDNTEVSDLDALRGLTSLQTLSLDSTQVSDLDALRGLTGLQTLTLDDTQVSDLDALRGLTGLHMLRLDGTQVSDLDALRGLTSLQTLSLYGTKVTNLDPLRGLTSLQTLSLDGTKVTDLDPLHGLTGLQMLTLDSTQVSDLDALRGLTGLVVLDCGISPVRDIAPLSALPNLSGLRVRAAAIRDWRIVDHFSALERLYVDGSVPHPRPRVKRRGLRLVINGDDFETVADDLLHRARGGPRRASKPRPRRVHQPN